MVTEHLECEQCGSVAIKIMDMYLCLILNYSKFK